MNSAAESDTDAFIRREQENMLKMNRQLQLGLAMQPQPTEAVMEPEKEEGGMNQSQHEEHDDFNPSLYPPATMVANFRNRLLRLIIPVL